MKLFQIQAFLTLSNTLNYTKASVALHTTQPNLSKIIVNLEEEVGCKLFIRNKRDVKLTPAGEVFSDAMRTLMKQYSDAIDDAQKADSGIRGSIKIGFLDTALVQLLPRIVTCFKKQHPDILLKLAGYPFSQLMDTLLENKVDIAFLPDHALDHMPHFERKFLSASDMCLVLNKTHPYAGRQGLDLTLVKNQPFVMMDPNISHYGYNLMMNVCTENNFVPKTIHYANSLTTVLLMVECDFGVSVMASHMNRYATQNTSFVKINGCDDYFRMSCAWRRKNPNPCIPKLLDVIDKCIEENDV